MVCNLVMKTYVIIISIFTALLILIPMVTFLTLSSDDSKKDESFILGSSNQEITTTTIDSTEETTSNTQSLTISDDYTTFKVLDSTTYEVIDVSAKDYVIGSVCAEMPALFEVEALKAQAVASYTYAIRLKDIQKTTPSDELHGADFSNDSTKYQAFLTNSQIKEYYGSNYDEYYEKVSSAVEEVLGQVIVYSDELIVPVFHSISSGVTEDAQNVWGYSVPYLVSVDSSQDVSANDFEEVTTFTPTEIKSKFTETYSDITFSSDCTSWISIQSTSEAGTVISVNVGSKTISGQEFRNVLGLRSSVFEVSYNGDTFDISTKGYGHDVGMSQYGANQLALEGYSYIDILKYYYSGVEVVDINSLQS
ncbi:MAG: stage II sporulation protein D [Ruminococcus sp.]|nr:stage II sporulation protein D [Ruminococcus sp.]